MPVQPTFRNRVIRTARATQTLTLSIATPTTTQLVDGVMEGGATLGAAYVGSLRLMQQAGIWFRRVAGNSAGAITASLVAAGYDASEIEWLTSNFPQRPQRPASLPPGLAPIDFMSFLDFPGLNSIGRDSMRKTVLWQALKGQAIDNVLATPLPIPTQSNVVNSTVSALKSVTVIGGLVNGPVEQAVRGVLNGVLGFLPNRQPTLSDYSLFDETRGLRTQFADTVWTAVARKNPLLLIGTQLLHEGSLFEGQNFLDTMETLLSAKIRGNPSRVQFRHLPIPLAVIGCNYRSGVMEVYSSQATPNMGVAEAVRRSMSLPLVFQPRGDGREKNIIDGGVSSNFPVWLYTRAADVYWPPNSIDPNRPKVGLSLDQTKAAPRAWNASPAKFTVSGIPPRVNLLDVVVAMLVASLKESGVFVPSPGFGESDLEDFLRSWKLLDVLIGWLSVDKETSSRKAIVDGLMGGMRYFDIEIPLLGFHGFDFSINGDRDDMHAIAERGFMAARDALSAAPTTGAPLLVNPGNFRNPY